MARLYWVIIFVNFYIFGLANIARAQDVPACTVPIENWRPRDDLREKLLQEGWNVRSIRSEQGCYLARLKDAAGNKHRMLFNPLTFERLAHSP